MEYRKFENTYFIRIDRGEEILASLAELCTKEQITLGTLYGIGAVGVVPDMHVDVTLEELAAVVEVMALPQRPFRHRIDQHHLVAQAVADQAERDRGPHGAGADHNHLVPIHRDHMSPSCIVSET